MMKKKLMFIVDALVVLALTGAGVWWYNTRGRERTITVTPSSATHETAAAEKKPESPKEQFVVPMFTATSTYGTEKVMANEPKKLPDAVKFQSFSYDPAQGKIIAVSGGCTDAYYAVLVFDAKTDYRKDPAAARVNRAFQCPTSKVFHTEFNLRDFNLPAGSYYFFVVDQGAQGSWYNPR